MVNFLSLQVDAIPVLMCLLDFYRCGINKSMLMNVGLLGLFLQLLSELEECPGHRKLKLPD